MNDAAALASNPLCARVFEDASSVESAAVRVRAMVRSALPEGSRCRAIVERTDIGGESHKAAMRALGLSRRQFYRERAAAAARVAAAFAERPAIDAMRTPADDVRERIESVRSSLYDGHAADVVDAVNGLLETQPPGALLASLFSLRAAARGQRGDVAGMRADLALVRSCAAGERDRAEMHAAAAEQELAQGRYGASLAHMDRAVALSPGGGSDPFAARLRAKLRWRRALQRQESGDIAGALDDLQAAREAIALLPRVPLNDHAQVLIDTAFTRMAVRGQSHVALTEANEAHRLAAYHGLRAQEAWALVALAEVAFAAGAVHDAVRYARSAVPPARAGLGGEWLARLLLMVARTELRAGNRDRAQALLERAEAQAVAGNFFETCARFVRSEVIGMSGDPASAKMLADEALAMMGRRNETHYVGRAFVAAARARHALGEDTAAAELLEAGTEHLRRGAMLVHLADALRLQAEILQSERLRAEARDVLDAVAI